MKILITGAEGFIGSNLVWRLYKKQEIVALDYLKNRLKSNIPDVKYINHDLSIPFYIEPPDLVMHFAVISQEVVSWNPELESVNMKGMFNVLEFCRKNSIPLVFPSSCSIYGPGVLHKTTDPMNPKSLYAVGKLSCEEYAKFYHHAFDIDLTILRYSNIYGDLTYLENKYYPSKKGVVRIFLEKALANEPLPLIDGDQTRDFTFIDDAVEGTCKFIGLKGLSIINVATGVETSIKHLASMVEKTLGKKVKTVRTQKRKIDKIPKRSLDISGISDLWKPKYSLKEGLKLYAERFEGLK